MRPAARFHPDDAARLLLDELKKRASAQPATQNNRPVPVEADDTAKRLSQAPVIVIAVELFSCVLCVAACADNAFLLQIRRHRMPSRNPGLFKRTIQPLTCVILSSSKVPLTCDLGASGFNLSSHFETIFPKSNTPVEGIAKRLGISVRNYEPSSLPKAAIGFRRHETEHTHPLHAGHRHSGHGRLQCGARAMRCPAQPIDEWPNCRCDAGHGKFRPTERLPQLGRPHGPSSVQPRDNGCGRRYRDHHESCRDEQL